MRLIRRDGREEAIEVLGRVELGATGRGMSERSNRNFSLALSCTWNPNSSITQTFSALSLYAGKSRASHPVVASIPAVKAQTGRWGFTGGKVGSRISVPGDSCVGSRNSQRPRRSAPANSEYCTSSFFKIGSRPNVPTISCGPLASSATIQSAPPML